MDGREGTSGTSAYVPGHWSHFEIRDGKKIYVKNMKGGKEKWGQKEDPGLILIKIFYFSVAILKILLHPHIFNLIQKVASKTSKMGLL